MSDRQPCSACGSNVTPTFLGTCPICGEALPARESVEPNPDVAGSLLAESAVAPADAELREAPSGAALAALAVVFLGAGGMFLVPQDWVNSLIIGTIALSSVLVCIDAWRIPSESGGETRGTEAFGLLIGMVLLWLIVFPALFVRRSRLAAPNLIGPAVVGTLLFTASPWLRHALVPLELPACDSEDVKGVLQKIVTQPTAAGAGARVLDVRETAFDATTQERKGVCTVENQWGRYAQEFVVTWNDRQDGLFEVKTLIPTELPECRDARILTLVFLTLRDQGRHFDGTFRRVVIERRRDAETGRRSCSCEVEGQTGKELVEYVVEWMGDTDRTYGVRLLAAELPACDSPEVRAAIEQALRAPGAPLVRSIREFGELRYDADAPRRYGTCFVEFEQGILPVNFTVDWFDRELGTIAVRIVGGPAPTAEVTL